MSIIHFGTDGWRARIDEDFTDDNVARVADACGRIWAEEAPGARVYVGYDTRIDAARFARIAAGTVAAHGLEVVVSRGYCPTSALAWTVADDAAACGGIMLTGSHNPGEYQGIKIRMADGGTATEEVTDRIEALLGPVPTHQPGPFRTADLMGAYADDLVSLVDADLIASAGLRVVNDAMYGATRGHMARLLGRVGVESVEIRGDAVDDFMDIHPEPIEPWIDACERAVPRAHAAAGLVSDGAGDRIAAVDEHGRVVSPHILIALILGHLVRNRGMSGRVVLAVSSSVVTRTAAKRLGCPVTIVPTGFRWIYGEMSRGDVLLGGEESGGIGIPDHMPARDGMLMALLLCELLAKSGRSLSELVAEVESQVGRMEYARRDLRLPNEVIETFRTVLPGLNPRRVCGMQPVTVNHMDGLRLDFEDRSWLLMRPSGTERLVRVYAEAPTVRSRDDLLEAGCAMASGEYGE